MSLPERPSLEYLKKLAKDRLPALRRADPTARLADAQLAVAREHGFPSWRALRTRLTVLEATHGHEPSRDDSDTLRRHQARRRARGSSHAHG